MCVRSFATSFSFPLRFIFESILNSDEAKQTEKRFVVRSNCEFVQFAYDFAEPSAMLIYVKYILLSTPNWIYEICKHLAS